MSEALTAGKVGVDGTVTDADVLSASISLQPLRRPWGSIAPARLAALQIRLTILEQAKRAGVAAQEAGGQAPAGEARDGVAALVLQAKALVEQLGKEEAKRLIDAL